MGTLHGLIEGGLASAKGLAAKRAGMVAFRLGAVCIAYPATTRAGNDDSPGNALTLPATHGADFANAQRPTLADGQ